MKLITLVCSLTLMTAGFAAQSETLTAEQQAAADAQLVEDCKDEANKDNDECLLLPPVEEATNFIFALAPLLPLAAAAGLIAAASGGGGTSTPSSNP